MGLAESAGKEDPEQNRGSFQTISINGVNSGLRAASPAARYVVGGCGRDNLVRGSLRGGRSPLYGDPVASLQGPS